MKEDEAILVRETWKDIYDHDAALITKINNCEGERQTTSFWRYSQRG